MIGNRKDYWSKTDYFCADKIHIVKKCYSFANILWEDKSGLPAKHAQNQVQMMDYHENWDFKRKFTSELPGWSYGFGCDDSISQRSSTETVFLTTLPISVVTELFFFFKMVQLYS